MGPGGATLILKGYKQSLSFEAFGAAHNSNLNDCGISVESTHHCHRLTDVV